MILASGGSAKHLNASSVPGRGLGDSGRMQQISGVITQRNPLTHGPARINRHSLAFRCWLFFQHPTQTLGNKIAQRRASLDSSEGNSRPTALHNVVKAPDTSYVTPSLERPLAPRWELKYKRVPDGSKAGPATSDCR